MSLAFPLLRYNVYAYSCHCPVLFNVASDPTPDSEIQPCLPQLTLFSAYKLQIFEWKLSHMTESTE